MTRLERAAFQAIALRAMMAISPGPGRRIREKEKALAHNCNLAHAALDGKLKEHAGEIRAISKRIDRWRDR